MIFSRLERTLFQFNFKTLASLLSFAALAGVASPSLATEDATVRSTPILLTLGGFNSCDSQPTDTHIEQRFESAILEYRYQVMKHSRRVPKVMRGCFVNSPVEGNVYHFSGLDHRVQSLRVSGLLDTGAKQANHLSFLVKSLAYSVIAQSRKVKNPIVYVMGHSQGAWLGAAVANVLASHNIEVGGLLTLDPISPLFCNVGEYVLRGGVPAPGCLTSPPDWISDVVAATLKATDGVWYNFYQTQFVFLHSGSIAELQARNQDFRLSYKIDSLKIKPAHTRIDDDLRPWSMFATQTALSILKHEKALNAL